jgi:hypothetical protein
MRLGLTRAVSGFFGELKRRRVLQAGGAYIAGAWLGAEILQFLLAQFQAPGWTYRVLAIVLVVGFPLSVILAWTIQVQEDGSWALDPERGDYRTLFAAIVLGVAITAGLSWLIVPERPTDPPYRPMPDSIAVAPFPADDLYDELMIGLRQSPGLRIVALTNDPGATSPLALGRQLRVGSLIRGRIEQDTLIVVLLDVVADRVTWERSYSDASAFRIANDLLTALGYPSLSRREFMGTDDVATYEMWLAATLADDFAEVITRDNSYVRAHIGLALATIGTYGLSMDGRAAAAVDAALALDPDSADAISLYGLGAEIRQLRIQAFERAIELDADHHLSYYRYAMEMKQAGELEVAENLIRQALLFAPQDHRYREVLDQILRMRN